MVTHPRNSELTNPRKSGFSLVELLVVIAIISIMLTLGISGLGNLAAGKSLPTALSNAEALFDEARTMAISKGVKTRVLISVGDAQSPDYLRKIAIIYQEFNPVTNQPVPDSWVLANRGMVLPEKVFFSKTYSKLAVDGVAGTGAALADTATQKMTLTANANIKADYAGNYLYYEFDSTGDSSGGTKAATFVLGNGVRPQGNVNPEVTASAKREIGGFVIWSGGQTSLFRSPDQIVDAGTPITTF